MKIAIQGHPTRGKEVIQILESLGGIDMEGLTGTCKTFYYINHRNKISDTLKSCLPSTYKCYTLEEFKKEFPFKIGDTAYFDNHPFVIEGITEHESNPAYRGYLVKLGPAIIETTVLTKMKQERNITLTLDKAKEWYKKGGELREIALQAFTEKELNPLPRSWKEFCTRYNTIKDDEYYIDVDSNLLRVNDMISNHNRLAISDRNICPSKESAEAHLAMIQLEQLRDCWRQGWKPTPKKEIYAIKTYIGKLGVFCYCTREFLSFPTRKMAEEFLECFRDLIEKAGDLI